jgi:hypothetical protein
MKQAWKDRGFHKQWNDAPRDHMMDPFIGPVKHDYDVLRHISDLADGAFDASIGSVHRYRIRSQYSRVC